MAHDAHVPTKTLSAFTSPACVRCLQWIGRFPLSSGVVLCTLARSSRRREVFMRDVPTLRNVCLSLAWSPHSPAKNLPKIAALNLFAGLLRWAEGWTATCSLGFKPDWCLLCWACAGVRSPS